MPHPPKSLGWSSLRHGSVLDVGDVLTLPLKDEPEPVTVLDPAPDADGEAFLVRLWVPNSSARCGQGGVGNFRSKCFGPLCLGHFLRRKMYNTEAGGGACQ